MTRELSIANIWNDLLSIGAPMLTGMCVTLILWIVYIVLRAKGILVPKRKKKLQKQQAIRDGHVLTARRVSVYYKNERQYSYRARFAYEAAGRTYSRGVVSRMEPPETLKMYYTDDPAKAFSDYDLGPSRWQILGFILPACIGALVTRLLQ
ncbi:MAG: hypothetical protein IJ594_08375 [Oscillospiraceae bacterium]|nr:hypothetical protein [Oscillospiraceae bacterium]